MSSAETAEQPVGALVPGWTRREPVRAVHLVGRYVRLEPLTAEHAPDLLTTLARPEDEALWTYRSAERPADLTALRGLIAADVAAPGVETHVLVPREGAAAGRAAGLASWARIEPEHGQAEIAGVLFASALQRTRAATEAIHLLMAHAFDALGYRRVEWKCDSLNAPSRRAAARLGFTEEGRFRHHLVVKGRNRDTDWFSVTDAEWPAVAARHRAWLDPAGFGPGGAQRRALDRVGE